MKFGIGQPLKRKEDSKFITGNGSYTDDINLENQFSMYIVRSPYAFANIKNINFSAAEKKKGVLKIINFNIIEKLKIKPMSPGFVVKNKDGSEMVKTLRNILAKKKVRYVGQPILAIIAVDLYTAEEASDLIEIEYDVLQSTTNIKDAIDNDAPIVRDELSNNICFDWELGEKQNTNTSINNSDYKIDIKLVNNRLVPNPMECRSTIGSYNKKNGEYSLYCSSQGVHSLKRKLADILNENEKNINVYTLDVGGGFGMKIFNYPEYVLTLIAAKVTGKIIKWKASRSESFISDIHGRDHYSKATLGLNKDYKITGLKVETLANIGAYISDFGVFIPTYAGTGMLTGCYKVPCAYANIKGVYTNTNPVDAYRGAGRPEAAYLIERLIDKSARLLNISPIDLRKINLIESSDMPYKTALGHTYDSGDFKKNLNLALEKSNFENFEERKKISLQNNKLRGIGISTYIEACGGGGPEYATISLGKNGNIEVKIGTQSNGQGHATTYAQIVADVLDIDIDLIDIIQGNSKEIIKGSGTGGSRSMPVGGSALYKACKEFFIKSKEILASSLSIKSNSLDYEKGIFIHEKKSYSLTDILEISNKNNQPLEVFSEWTPPLNTYTYPNGTHICELEIDKNTGTTKIITYTVVDDFGKVINPLLLEGQVHGGIVQGIGQALFEETIYDKETGQLLTGSFMDYAIPRASDLPNFNFYYNEILCKTNLLGVKGAGEAGAIGSPPAVINALCNAIDVDHIDMPAKPIKIWNIINSKKKS
ncbi:MAG: carbon monoxide dehydrogenase [Rickettsiales bacterium]|nr:carbon monoxide dehydrogenase [Rickettsiales bacterium]